MRVTTSPCFPVLSVHGEGRGSASSGDYPAVFDLQSVGGASACRRSFQQAPCLCRPCQHVRRDRVRSPASMAPDTTSTTIFGSMLVRASRRSASHRSVIPRGIVPFPPLFPARAGVSTWYDVHVPMRLRRAAASLPIERSAAGVDVGRLRYDRAGSHDSMVPIVSGNA
jgi:hypothetical protein